jgi:hypothetical protein
VAGAGRESAELTGTFAVDTLRFAVPAILAFGAGVLVGDALSSGVVASLIAGAVGSVLYALALLVAAPRQAEVLTGRLRPLAPPAS